MMFERGVRALVFERGVHILNTANIIVSLTRITVHSNITKYSNRYSEMSREQKSWR